MRYLLFLICLLCSGLINGQEPDSVKTIDTVTIQAFSQGKDLATAVVRKIENPLPGSGMSLVTAFNTVSGVRMEERSPGSYRIAIRGSSLRSPFGVRNVKVYYGYLPLTDPGGNTYFNQLAVNNFNSITIFKGPASGMYGAGTGGLILIDPLGQVAAGASVELFGGSYGAKNILAEGTWKRDNMVSKITVAHNATDGYREQTALRRDNLSWNTRFKWNKQELQASLLFTDMYYQTPGGLTLTEFLQNPRSARPAAGGYPSAKKINAAIWQKNLTAGLTHKIQFTDHWSNATTLYGSYSAIKNSAIRNFEQRSEPQFGGRTVFNFDKKWNQAKLTWTTGAEGQEGYSVIRVSDNKSGKPDTLRTDDNVTIGTYSLFTQAILSLADKWAYTAGVSFNRSRLNFSRVNVYTVTGQVFHYSNEIAPRFTLLRKLKPFDILATVSKGFSPPTVAEILPSTTILNKDLKAEHGWNYELTFKKNINGFSFEATGFILDLKDGLVQLRDTSGADYFTNANVLHQKGAEVQAAYFRLLNAGSFFDYVSANLAYTYTHFRYGTFMRDGASYAGKTVPGVPASTLNMYLILTSKCGVFVHADYYNAAAIYLNDANTARADRYHLLGARLGYKKKWKNIIPSFYIGADNLFNETYSLGNDINAAGGRYYNAAPKRNYYIGAAFEWR